MNKPDAPKVMNGYGKRSHSLFEYSGSLGVFRPTVFLAQVEIIPLPSLPYPTLIWNKYHLLLGGQRAFFYCRMAQLGGEPVA